MSNFDLKTFLLNVAPSIAAGLGGPLAGTAVQALSNALTGKPDSTEVELAKLASKGLNPEQFAAIKKVDNDFAIAMKNADIDLVKINNAHDEAYLADVQDARKNNASNDDVFKLGIVILLTFAFAIGLSLYGSYQLLVGGIVPKDPATVAAVFGSLGTLIGYLSSNAQSVIQFYYGSSQGSANKTQAMQEAFKSLSGKWYENISRLLWKSRSRRSIKN